MPMPFFTFFRPAVAGTLIAIAAAGVACAQPVTTGRDIAAIHNREDVVQRLGAPIDRVISLDLRSYRVEGGGCHLIVTVIRTGRPGPDGRRVYGALDVPTMSIGERRCK